MLKGKFAWWYFQANQLEAFAQYLGQQAEKGWFIDCEKSNLWMSRILHFKKWTPGKRKYSVVLFPDAPLWDNEGDYTFDGYKDMCEECGWTYVGSTNPKYKIFVTEDLQAVPVETNQDLNFECVGYEILHKTVPFYGLCSLLMVFILATFFANPSEVLTKNTDLFLIGAGIFLLVFLLMEFIQNLRWYLNTKKKLEKGISIVPYSMKHVRWNNVLFICVFLVYIMLGGTKRQVFDPKQLLVYLLVIGLVVMVYHLIYLLVKKMEIGSEEGSFGVFIIVSIIAVVAIISVFTTVSNKLWPELYAYQDDICTEQEISLPIDPKESGYQWDETYTVYREKSLLAEKQGAHYTRLSDGQISQVSVIWYSAKADWVYKILSGDMKADKGNAYQITGPNTQQFGDVTVDSYEYETDFEDASDYRLIIIKTDKNLLTLEFTGEADAALVEQAIERMTAFFGSDWAGR